MITAEEKELIYLLAQKLTGAHPEGTYQIEVFITNIARRMRESGIGTVKEYLAFAKENADEHSHLLSALSIHTTSWFRENPHYVILQRVLLERRKKTPYRAWSSACSTGEEVYSLALLFEEFRRFHPAFDYTVQGSDIDPISLEHARRAIYEMRHLNGPLSYYKKHVLLGSGNTENYFTFTPDVRKRCSFKSLDIRSREPNPTTYDLILCRNVLIYFQAWQVDEVILRLLSQLNAGGHLILGHSEMIDYQRFGLKLLGHSVYEKTGGDTVRRSTYITGPNQTKPTPASSAAQIIRPCPDNFRVKCILIGASTGGPEALGRVLKQMPNECPPVVVAQHIAAEFSRGFAQRLSEISGLRLGTFADRTAILPGHIYCAQADQHLVIERHAGHLLLRQEDQGTINGHRPNIDHLFQSAQQFADECLVILLSGMGRDGADGMHLLHDHGAYTLAQAEDDCVVFGMPKEAILQNAVDFIGSANQIHESILQIIRRQLF